MGMDCAMIEMQEWESGEKSERNLTLGRITQFDDGSGCVLLSLGHFLFIDIHEAIGFKRINLLLLSPANGECVHEQTQSEREQSTA